MVGLGERRGEGREFNYLFYILHIDNNNIHYMYVITYGDYPEKMQIKRR